MNTCVTSSLSGRTREEPGLCPGELVRTGTRDPDRQYTPQGVVDGLNPSEEVVYVDSVGWDCGAGHNYLELRRRSDSCDSVKVWVGE